MARKVELMTIVKTYFWNLQKVLVLGIPEIILKFLVGQESVANSLLSF